MTNEINKKLFDACSYLNLEEIKSALQKGANINAINDSGETPLANAIAYYWVVDMESNRKYTDDEHDALKKSNYAKLVPIVDFLLENGADINLFENDGIPPIVRAYYTNTPELVKYLLEKGANPNVNCYRNEPSEKDYCSTILSCINELFYEEYDDKAKEIERIVLQYGGRLYHFGYNPIKREYTGRTFIEIWPTPDCIFYDSGSYTCGDYKTLHIEINENEYADIDISSVKGWEQWHQEIVDDYYGKKYKKTEKEWNEWFDRGLVLAKQLATILPKNVDLYYLYNNKPIFCSRQDGSKYWNQNGERILVEQHHC
jgi:ankyrin repeat protein